MAFPRLPERLHAAYDWTAAAGEVSWFRSLSGTELAEYVRDSIANFQENPSGATVTESALEELHSWLNGEGATY